MRVLVQEGDEFLAETRAELYRGLQELDLVVPRQTEGRKAWHREQHCLVLYLRARLADGSCALPVRVRKSERPDYDIQLGGEAWGLEMTDAGTEASQQANSALELAPDGSVIEGEATIRLPGQPLGHRGYANDEAATEWAALLRTAARKKVEKLVAATPLRRRDVELLIYDNTYHPGLLCDEEARGYVLKELKEELPSLAAVGISKVSILDENRLLLDAGNEYQFLSTRQVLAGIAMTNRTTLRRSGRLAPSLGLAR